MVEEEQEEVEEVVVEEDDTRPHRPCGDDGCWDYDSCFDIRAACPPVAVSPQQAWPALPDGELALHGMQWLGEGASSQTMITTSAILHLQWTLDYPNPSGHSR